MKMQHRPAGMTYKAYTSMCKAASSEAMDEEDFDKLPEKEDEDKGDEDKEKEDEDESEKAEIALDDLQKSLDALEAQTAATAVESRGDFLEARLKAGTITKSEREELGRIWVGGDAKPEPSTDLRKSMEDGDPKGAELVDMSPALTAFQNAIGVSLSAHGQMVKSEGERTRATVAGLSDVVVKTARAQIANGQLLKSMSARLEKVESTPAPRRGVSTPAALTKSRNIAGNGGEDPAGDALSKAEIDRGFNILVQKAAAADDDAALDALSLSAARYEQFHSIDRNTDAAIRAVVRPN